MGNTIDTKKVRHLAIPDYGKRAELTAKQQKDAVTRYDRAATTLREELARFKGKFVGTDQLTDIASLSRMFPACRDVDIEGTRYTNPSFFDTPAEVRQLFDDYNRCVDAIARADFSDAAGRPRPTELEPLPRSMTIVDMADQFYGAWSLAKGADSAVMEQWQAVSDFAKQPQWDYLTLVRRLKEDVARARAEYARLAAGNVRIELPAVDTQIEVKAGRKTIKAKISEFIDGKGEAGAAFSAFLRYMRDTYYVRYAEAASRALGRDVSKDWDFDAKMKALPAAERTGERVLALLGEFKAYVEGQLNSSAPEGGGRDIKFPEDIARMIEALPLDEKKWVEARQTELRVWLDRNLGFIPDARDLVENGMMKKGIGAREFTSGYRYLKSLVDYQIQSKRVDQRFDEVERRDQALASSIEDIRENQNTRDENIRALARAHRLQFIPVPRWKSTDTPEGNKKRMLTWLSVQAYYLNVTPELILEKSGFLSPDRKDDKGNPLPMNIKEFEAALSSSSDDFDLEFNYDISDNFVAWQQAQNSNVRDVKVRPNIGNTGKYGLRTNASFGFDKGDGNSYMVTIGGGWTGIDGVSAEDNEFSSKKGAGGLIGPRLQNIAVEARHNVGHGVSINWGAGWYDGNIRVKGGLAVKATGWLKPGVDFSFGFRDQNSGEWTHDLGLRIYTKLNFERQIGIEVEPYLAFNDMVRDRFSNLGAGVSASYDGTRGGVRNGAKVGFSYAWNNNFNRSPRLGYMDGHGHDFSFEAGYYTADDAPWGGVVGGIAAFIDVSANRRLLRVNDSNSPSEGSRSDTAYGIFTGLRAPFIQGGVVVIPSLGYVRQWNSKVEKHGVGANLDLRFK